MIFLLYATPDIVSQSGEQSFSLTFQKYFNRHACISIAKCYVIYANLTVLEICISNCCAPCMKRWWRHEDFRICLLRLTIKAHKTQISILEDKLKAAQERSKKRLVRTRSGSSQLSRLETWFYTMYFSKIIFHLSKACLVYCFIKICMRFCEIIITLTYYHHFLIIYTTRREQYSLTQAVHMTKVNTLTKMTFEDELYLVEII
uniref:Transmembrane protein n=1 Tax=Heterorhabditis bacteriophora TaxID=37862 RepID=A0A1I7W6M4_HETBA